MGEAGVVGGVVEGDGGGDAGAAGKNTGAALDKIADQTSNEVGLNHPNKLRIHSQRNTQR